MFVDMFEKSHWISEEQDELVFIPPMTVITKSLVSTLTEILPYFKLAEYRLDRQDHGVPECPEIIKNPKEASWGIPQAWSEKFILLRHHPLSIRGLDIL